MARGESPYQGRYNVPMVDFSPVERGGAAWGQAFQNVGGAIAGGIRENKELKAKLRQYETTAKMMEEWIPTLLDDEEQGEKLKKNVREFRQRIKNNPDLSLRQQVAMGEGLIPEAHVMLGHVMRIQTEEKQYGGRLTEMQRILLRELGIDVEDLGGGGQLVPQTPLVTPPPRAGVGPNVPVTKPPPAGNVLPLIPGGAPQPLPTAPFPPTDPTQVAPESLPPVPPLPRDVELMGSMPDWFDAEETLARLIEQGVSEKEAVALVKKRAMAPDLNERSRLASMEVTEEFGPEALAELEAEYPGIMRQQNPGVLGAEVLSEDPDSPLIAPLTAPVPAPSGDEPDLPAFDPATLAELGGGVVGAGAPAAISTRWARGDIEETPRATIEERRDWLRKSGLPEAEVNKQLEALEGGLREFFREPPEGLEGPKGETPAPTKTAPKAGTPYKKQPDLMYNGKMHANGRPQIVPREGRTWKHKPGSAEFNYETVPIRGLSGLFKDEPPPPQGLKDFFNAAEARKNRLKEGFAALDKEDTKALMALFIDAKENDNPDSAARLERLATDMHEAGVVDYNVLIDMVKAEYGRIKEGAILPEELEVEPDPKSKIIEVEPDQKPKIIEGDIPPKPVDIPAPKRKQVVVPNLNPKLAGEPWTKILKTQPREALAALKDMAPPHVKFNPKMRDMYEKIMENPALVMLDPDIARFASFMMDASTMHPKWVEDQIKLMQNLHDLQADLNNMSETDALAFVSEKRKTFPDATFSISGSGGNFTVNMTVAGRKPLKPVVAFDSEGKPMPTTLYSRGGDTFYVMTPKVIEIDDGGVKVKKIVWEPQEVGTNGAAAFSYEGTQIKRALDSLKTEVIGYDQNKAAVTLAQWVTFFKDRPSSLKTVGDVNYMVVSGRFRNEDGQLTGEEEWMFDPSQITKGQHAMINQYIELKKRERDLAGLYRGYPPFDEKPKGDPVGTGVRPSDNVPPPPSKGGKD